MPHTKDRWTSPLKPRTNSSHNQVTIQTLPRETHHHQMFTSDCVCKKLSCPNAFVIMCSIAPCLRMTLEGLFSPLGMRKREQER